MLSEELARTRKHYWNPDSFINFYTVILKCDLNVAGVQEIWRNILIWIDELDTEKQHILF